MKNNQKEKTLGKKIGLLLLGVFIWYMLIYIIQGFILTNTALTATQETIISALQILLPILAIIVGIPIIIIVDVIKKSSKSRTFLFSSSNCF